MKKVYDKVCDFARKIAVTFCEDIKHGSQVLLQHLKNRNIWWLKYLVLIIVATVALAIWAQATRDTENPNRFAKWLYNFFNDWSALLFALGTLMLAMGAFLAIIDNRNERRLKVRTDTLRDIVTWARDSIAELEPSISEVRLMLPTIMAGSHVAIANARGIEIEILTLVENAVTSLDHLNLTVFSGEDVDGDLLKLLTIDVVERLTEVIEHASRQVMTI